MKLFLVLAIAACGGSQHTTKPEGDPMPATAPLPPVASPDGVYVDPDAKFSIQLPPGRHFIHGTNALLQASLVSADVGRGNVTVMFWKPPHPATADTLDSLLRDTSASATKQPIADVAFANATVARGYRYENDPELVPAHGEVRAYFRDPWIVILIVFAEKGGPFESQAAAVLDSFKL
jgi:hypothetical protein